jgi:hypothetical protein
MELLNRLGARWAVLAAMNLAMHRKGIAVAPGDGEKLRMARVKIASGCFSPCEVACALAEVESRLFSKCHLLPEKDFTEWSDLLGEAMQGKLDYNRIQGIPALEPVKNDCAFLGCSCAERAAGA